MPEVGESCQIDAWTETRAPECADRAHVVMTNRIRIQRDPVGEEWKPPGEVEGTHSISWIVSSVLFASSGLRINRYVLKAEEAVQKSVQRDGRVAFAAPDGQPVETELQIACGLEGDLL